jgi:hypothetical protein
MRKLWEKRNERKHHLSRLRELGQCGVPDPPDPDDYGFFSTE